MWVAPEPEPEPIPEPQAWQPAPAPEPEPPSWQPSPSPAPLGQSWEQPATPKPAQTWETPAPSWDTPQTDLRADLAAALDARIASPVAEPEPAPQAPMDLPPAQDERLAALSGVFSPPAAAPLEAAPQPEPAPRDHINEWSRMAGTMQVAPAPEEKKKGLFGFLKKDEVAAAGTAGAATDVEPVARVGRAGQLASFSNALLAEYNSGKYGKGRLDDRMANLLMRVDEQAEPIDRPLPIVDDRIDAQALDRENVPEVQAVPYLAILVSQIYEDAERTFGKDKAKKGYRAAQQQVFGADASALAAPDVSGRLPKV